MSSGKNSWTREVVAQMVIPIRIDPKATDEEAEEVAKHLLKDFASKDDIITLKVNKLTFFAIPLEEIE